MKSLFFLILMSGALTDAAATRQPVNVYEVCQQELTLDNIQQQITSAFTSSLAAKNNEPLNTLIAALERSYQHAPDNLYLYWKAYSLFHNSMYYLQRSDKSNAKRAVQQGIEVLQSIEKKTSEDYALLSMLHGFSIQFSYFPKVIKISKQLKQCSDKALELNPNNLRAYYVLANNDYYRPERFGGGKVVEANALKALSLSVQQEKNSSLPSWGRQESYELLTNWYIRKNNTAAAVKYLSHGLAEFPDSQVLKAAKKKLSH